MLAGENICEFSYLRLFRRENFEVNGHQFARFVISPTFSIILRYLLEITKSQMNIGKILRDTKLQTLILSLVIWEGAQDNILMRTQCTHMYIYTA